MNSQLIIFPRDQEIAQTEVLEQSEETQETSGEEIETAEITEKEELTEEPTALDLV